MRHNIFLSLTDDVTQSLSDLMTDGQSSHQLDDANGRHTQAQPTGKTKVFLQVPLSSQGLHSSLHAGVKGHSDEKDESAKSRQRGRCSAAARLHLFFTSLSRSRRSTPPPPGQPADPRSAGWTSPGRPAAPAAQRLTPPPAFPAVCGTGEGE